MSDPPRQFSIAAPASQDWRGGRAGELERDAPAACSQVSSSACTNAKRPPDYLPGSDFRESGIRRSIGWPWALPPILFGLDTLVNMIGAAALHVEMRISDAA